MSGVANPAVSSLTAAMRYRDVAAAVEWLRSRLGFELHSSVRDDDGVMVYAQVAFGNAMVMLAPIQDTALDQYMRQPDEIGGAETQSCYFYVADAAAHFAKAKKAGAEIILSLEPYDSGGEGYSCRDPEGHIWTFGSFDPWGRDGGKMLAASAVAGHPQPRRRLARILGLAAVLGVSGAAAAWLSGADIAGVVGGGSRASHERPAATAAVVREETIEAANALQAQLTAEKAARDAAEQTASAAAAELKRERGLRETARREMNSMQSRASAEEAARAEAEAKVAGFAAEAERQRTAREEAERKVEAAAVTAASQQAARITAETAAREAKAEADKLRSTRSTVAAAPDNSRDMQRLTAEREAAEVQLRQMREELAREHSAREAAEQASQEAVRRADAAEAASAAAGASVTHLQSQLAAEQAAKRSAWSAISGLRKQLSQVQRAKAAAAAASDADGAAEPAPAAPAVRKQIQRRQQPQRKRRPAPPQE